MGNTIRWGLAVLGLVLCGIGIAASFLWPAHSPGSFDALGAIAIFENPMPPKQAKEYETFLAKQSVKQLEKELAGQRSFQRMVKVLWELARRPNTDAIRILKEFQSKVSAKDPASRLVRAEVLVAVARAETTGDDTAYIKRLEEILSRKAEGESVDSAAYRLRSLGTKEARNALHRNERGNRPSVKIGRLLLDYGTLGDEEFVQAILASVRQVSQEYKAKTVPALALIAERSVLGGRGNAVIPLIEKELTYLRWISSQPSDESHRKYVRYLKNLLGSLKRARAMREGLTTRPTTTTAPLSRPVLEASNRGHLLFGLEDNRLRIVRACEERLGRIPKTRSILTEDEVLVIWALGSYRSDALPTLEALLRVVHMRKKKSTFPKSNWATMKWRPLHPELLTEYPAARALINIGLPGVRAIAWTLDASGEPPSEERARIYAGVVFEILGAEHARPFMEIESKAIPGRRKNYDAVLRFIDKICAQRRSRELERNAEIRKMLLKLKAARQQEPKFAKAPATRPVTRPATKPAAQPATQPATTTMPGTLPQDN